MTCPKCNGKGYYQVDPNDKGKRVWMTECECQIDADRLAHFDRLELVAFRHFFNYVRAAMQQKDELERTIKRAIEYMKKELDRINRLRS